MTGQFQFSDENLKYAKWKTTKMLTAIEPI